MDSITPNHIHLPIRLNTCRWCRWNPRFAIISTGPFCCRACTIWNELCGAAQMTSSALKLDTFSLIVSHHSFQPEPSVPVFFFTLSPWPFISRSNFRTTRFPVDTLVPALPSHRIYQSNTCFPYIITCLGASFSPSSSDTLDNPSSRKCSVNHISTTRYIIILKIWHLESNLLFIIVSYATQEHVRLPCFWKTPTWIYTEKAIKIVVGMERRLVEHKHIYRNMEWITHS